MWKQLWHDGWYDRTGIFIDREYKSLFQDVIKYLCSSGGCIEKSWDSSTINVNCFCWRYKLRINFRQVIIFYACLQNCKKRLLGLGYTRDWLPTDSFVARAWAMVLNGSAHTVRHVRGKTKLSSSSADSPRQICVRTVGRLEK
jgi:hypothetical protein